MNEQNINPAVSETQSVYKLTSPRGSIWGLFITSVSTTLTLDEDHMDINIVPKRINKIPNIKYTDIASIENKNHFSWVYAAFGILGFYTIILPLLCIWLGRYRKINITLKNGNFTSLYCLPNKKSELLYNELKSRANIVDSRSVNNSKVDK